jgi:hypothetical protein
MKKPLEALGSPWKPLAFIASLLSLGGCSTSDESLCAEAVDGTEFCYENRVSQYAVQNFHSSRNSEFKELKKQAGNFDEDTLAYLKKQDAVCRKLTSEFGKAEWMCNLLGRNAITKNDIDVTLYRFLLFAEGSPAYNFQGRIISKYAPVMNQREIIEKFSPNKDKDYSSHEEYFRSLYTLCMQQFGTNLWTRGPCVDMKTGVELAMASGVDVDIRMVADWYYIAATFELSADNAFTPKQSFW